MGLNGFRQQRKPKATPSNILIQLSRAHTFLIRQVWQGLPLLVLAVTAIAQEESESSLFELSLSDLLDVQVVTAASGFEQNLKDAPASVTIIEEEEWRAAGAGSLLEAISQVPGIHIGVSQTGFVYEKPMIRGFSGAFGQQVLLLVDGLPYRSAREGGAPWSQYLSLEGFKRIEIIRGSGSAIYGADAVGGIINLISHTPAETPIKVSLTSGSNGLRAFSLTAGGQVSDHEFQLAYTAEVYDGDSGRTLRYDTQTRLDIGYGTQASLAPDALDSNYESHTLKARWKRGPLSLSYLDWRAPELGHGPGLSLALDPDGNTSTHSQLLDFHVDLTEYVPGDLKVRFAWQKFHVMTQATLFPAGTELYLDGDGNALFRESDDAGDQRVLFTEGMKGSPGSDSHTSLVQLNHIFEVGSRHKLRWAVGAEESDIHAYEKKNFGPGVYQQGTYVVDGELTDITGTDYVYLPDKERINYFFAVQDQIRFWDSLVATVGLRYDYFNDFGEVTNPRMGLTWQASPKLSFKLFSGSAFRAPSFVDLYTQNNPTSIGNPDLEPETVNMADVGFSANYVISDALQLESSLFEYSADKLIAFIYDGSEYRAANSGRLKLRGLEQQINWRSGDRLSVHFNATFLDPYEVVGVSLDSVPKCLANLYLHFRSGSWHSFIGTRWVMNRDRGTGALNESPVKDYALTNARIQYGKNQWQLALKIENLFDEEAREPMGISSIEDIPLAGREASLEVQWRFK